MYPKVIAVVGPIRAGKSTVCQYLTRRYGYILASNSDLLKEIANSLELVPDRNTLKRVGDALFTTLGNDLLARFRLRQAKFPIVVDGVRYPEEIAAYREEPTFRLVGVTAGDNARYQRIVALAHQGKDRNLSRTEFDELGFARSELEVERIMLNADHNITNDLEIDCLEVAVDAMMSHWSDAA